MSTVEEGLVYLLKEDHIFADQGWSLKDIGWQREIDPGFASLVRIIIGQQLSTKVAKTLWTRLETSLEEVTPERCLTLSDEDCRSFGFSAQKTKHLRGLCDAVLSKKLLLDSFVTLSDEKIHNQLTALKGFGPWSAQMYLIFSLGRPDVWPVADLGIQNGMQKYHALKDRPNEKETAQYGESFKPHRTAAALLSWKLNNAYLG